MRGGWHRAGLIGATLLATASCGGPADETAPMATPEDRPRAGSAAQPNVLFVVWDTVRADRLSLYGYTKPTTPRLERWATNARVFTQARATANSTVPTHASLFTGLLPSEHGSSAGHQYLDDRWDTLAELFQGAGYRTYLWAANPHLSDEENFTQGFDLSEHPWSKRNAEEARRIVLAKIPENDASSAMRMRLSRAKPNPGLLKAAGELAGRNAIEFLEQSDSDRPWFVFLNYMEAHRNYVPPLAQRRALMSEEQIERSYRVDRSWPAVWRHVFGLVPYSAEDVEVTAATYDATLRELDDLFAALLEDFESTGLLDDTVIVLTADHGELLGEHGLMDHQYSLYDPLIHVPLVLHDPQRIEPGVSDEPVYAMDVFPTLLELAGIEAPRGQVSRARSLLARGPPRPLLAEYPAVFERPFETVRKTHPDFEPAPWRRRLRAFQSGRYKLIEGEDGRHELYDVAADPAEQTNLAERDPVTLEKLRRALMEYVAEITTPGAKREPVPDLDAEQIRMLEELGYAETTSSRAGGARSFDVRTSWSITDAAD